MEGAYNGDGGHALIIDYNSTSYILHSSSPSTPYGKAIPFGLICIRVNTLTGAVSFTIDGTDFGIAYEEPRYRKNACYIFVEAFKKGTARIVDQEVTKF